MILSLLVWTTPLLIFIYMCNQYTLLPSSIPGPLLAKFTNLWRFLSVYKRHAEQDQLILHQRYISTSDLVRLGPDTVSVTGPGYISQIYGIDKKLPKSRFYATFQNIVNGRRAASLVAVTDDTVHSRMKRLVAHAYSLSTLVEFEPLIDRTTAFFLDTLGTRFKQGEVCDLGDYFSYYAFDVMGELTFSKRLGFIELGEDVDGIIASISANFDYFSLLGQMPWLDDLLGKNPLYIKYLRRPVSSPILKYAQKLLRERLRQLDSGDNSEKKSAKDSPDFLARFLAAKNTVNDKSGDESEPMTDALLLSLLFGNINAGSDTVATTMKAIFYYLFTHPETLTRLKQELRSAQDDDRLTLPCPTWAETQSENLPYLRAVIKEGVRLWPALALSLERIVTDPAGLPLTSPNDVTTFLPQGTIVGINPYVLHRDPRIFDPNFPSPSSSNVEQWDPARWLSGQDNSRGNTEQQLKTMEHSIMTFSHGKRTCLGKNIALMELHKLIPALILKFPDMRAVDELKGWKVRNSWVLGQKGLNVRFVEL